VTGDTYSPRTLRALLAGFALFALPAACSFASSPVPATGGAGLLGTKGRVEKGFSVLYSFQGSPDGATPFAGVVVDKSGNIFGTTFVDGAYNAGTVFELTPSGSSYSETIVHSFTSTDGDGPVDAPLEDASGNLYVTTLQGGEFGAGTAVALSPTGGGYAESGVFAFGNGSESGAPNAGFLEEGTTLYATTSSGGKYGAGAIVALSSSGLSYSDVHDFGNGQDGAYPLSNLVADSKGALYGTTVAGGTGGQGTVFKFVPSGSAGSETVIWNFQSGGKVDGNSPNGGVALDANGNVYGTTSAGGTDNDGILFELRPGKREYRESILHTFAGGPDGAVPIAGPTLKGKFLYGSTSSGSGSVCVACGTLFRIETSGTGYEILHTFGGNDGANPLGNLFVSGSALYGTTSNGGANSLGVVFQFVP